LPLPNSSDGRFRARRTFLTMAVAALLATPLSAAQYASDAVKAAYLFRFASYVEWPSGASSDAPFIFGVYGADDVAVHLERLVTGMSVRGRSARVRRVRGVQDLDGVQVLYVGSRVFRGARPLRLDASQRPILLVTDNLEGLQGGGVINFIEVNRNLRFEISLDAAARAGLRIDSALLAVAARVEARKK
jgi:hypothetical protein